MPGGVVRLSPEHRAGLVDPLEDTDHHLLVELRGLGQVGRASEVVHPEHVGAGLGGRRHELRRLDLGKAEPVQRGPEAAQRRGGQFPSRPPDRMTPGHRGVVQDRGQPGVEGGPPQVHRRRLRGLAEQRDPRFGHLGAARRGRVARGHAGDRDDGLLTAAPHDLPGLRVPDHHLGQARTVPDDEERHRAKLPAAVHPALDPDLATGCSRRQLSGQSAGKTRQRGCHDHSPPVRHEALEVRAGAKSRCHRTFAGVRPASSAVTGPAIRARKVSSPKARRPPSQLPAAL